MRSRLVAAACVCLVACGGSESRSPLILADQDAAPGPRELTTPQVDALRAVITGAGEPCAAIEQTYLREVGAHGESWDVRCADGSYEVDLPPEGQGVVRPCFTRFPDPMPCFQQPVRDRRAPGPAPPLNPELGKLLEPLTAKDGKVD